MILIVPTVLRIAMSMMNGASFEIGIGWSSSTDWTANHLSYWQFTLSLSKPSTSVYDRLCMDVNDELLEEEAMVNMLVGNLAPHLPRSPNKGYGIRRAESSVSSMKDIAFAERHWKVMKDYLALPPDPANLPCPLLQSKGHDEPIEHTGWLFSSRPGEGLKTRSTVLGD